VRVNLIYFIYLFNSSLNNERTEQIDKRNSIKGQPKVIKNYTN